MFICLTQFDNYFYQFLLSSHLSLFSFIIYESFVYVTEMEKAPNNSTSFYVNIHVKVCRVAIVKVIALEFQPWNQFFLFRQRSLLAWTSFMQGSDTEKDNNLKISTFSAFACDRNMTAKSWCLYNFYRFL